MTQQMSCFAFKPIEPEPVLFTDTIASDYEEFFEKEVFCDFELLMNDAQILKAHKAILMARSPVFFKMLITEMQEKSKNLVEIKDIDSTTMKELLRYVYCNKVVDLDSIASSLIVAAEKYQLKGLKELCCIHIISNLSEKNVLDALLIADRVTDTQKFFEVCVKFAVRHYRQLGKDRKWKEMSSELKDRVLHEVLQNHCSF